MDYTHVAVVFLFISYDVVRIVTPYSLLEKELIWFPVCPHVHLSYSDTIYYIQSTTHHREPDHDRT